MRIFARALTATAIVVFSILYSDPSTALSGVEVPILSCTANHGIFTGPAPADWQKAGELGCIRFAAAHFPVGCGNCPQDGTVCSSVNACTVQNIAPTMVGGGDRIFGTVLLTMTSNFPSCPVTQDLGQRAVFTCTCSGFAAFGADNRCYCGPGFAWNPTTGSCSPAQNCTGVLTEGNCLPGPQKPGKDCVDCPPRGDLTAGTNPINVATGVKFEPETYYRSAAEHGLSIAVVFTSGTSVLGQPVRGGLFGRNRTSGFDRSVRDTGTLGSFAYAIVTRPDGRRLDFRRLPSSSTLTADPDIADRLERVFDSAGQWAGYLYRSAERDVIEAYTQTGVFLFEEDRQGRRLQHSYSDGAGGHTSNPPGAEVFHYVAAACTPPAGWVYQVDAAGSAAGVLSAGRLICVTDHFGRQLHFQYDQSGRVTRIADPAAHVYRFAYDGISGGCNGSLENRACSAGNLTSVTFPDEKVRTYHYNEFDKVNSAASCAGKPAFSPGRAHLPNHLTGLVDEHGIRFATWTYDCQGRATSSEHAGGADRIVVAYDTPIAGQSTVADYRVDADTVNQNRVYSFAVTHGVSRNTSVSQPNDRSKGASASHAYDENGNIASRVDWNGNRTTFTHDLARNLEVSRTEGLTELGGVTPQTRTVRTEWHETFRLPARIAEPLRITTFAYDPDGSQCGARGALCSRTMQATTDASGQALSPTQIGEPRVWSYTYNGNGSVLTVNGPRTEVPDITVYTYYANDDADFGKRGNVATISNAAGHLTSITAYNAHGQPTRVIDPNGMTTTLAYDARQRLISRNAGGETTSYDYDGVGQLVKVTLPDSSFLLYSHDAAHRLSTIEDNLGNRISYTLDAMGNRTHEDVRDAADQLAQRRSRVYDALNRLFRDLGADKQTTEYAYDGQGNLISVKDPMNRVTSNQYDALNRLREVTDPARGVTRYAYNGLDALTSVTDPRGLVTGYTVDGLGNLTGQASPDTGTTLNTYDAAGNLLTQTDAKLQVTGYAYDALNRVTSIIFQDGSSQAYAYDQGPNAIGRLSTIAERDAANQVSSHTAYEYDLHGRATAETRSVNGVRYVVSYEYDGAGRLIGLRYAGGRSVHYGLDALGRVSQVSTAKGGQSQVVVQGVTYHPFGGMKSYVLGNGQVYSRSIDADGRIASYTLGVQSFDIGYDAASRIAFISDRGNLANSISYGYDDLDRLVSAVAPSTPYSYTYDAVGNRTSRTAGAGIDTYVYSATSNRIAAISTAAGLRSFVFDSNGSTTADGVNSYSYDVRGRMSQASSSLGATAYQVNALGQRIRKTNGIADTVFHYDIGGRLIAETDSAGSLKREYLYLGDIPVGVVQ